MSLNIKNEATCALARELADLTGESMTGAISVALSERLEREKKLRDVEARIDAMMAIGESCAKLIGPGPSSTEIGDFLYDERGLPK